METSGSHQLIPERRDFWSEVLTFNGSVTPFVQSRVLMAGAWGLIVWGVVTFTGVNAGFGVAPYELIGVVLALLLVLRTNSGYDRWYEGRKLWGGIVNQSRNLAVIAASYGTPGAAWRDRVLHWTALFPHLVRHSLRGERDLSDLRDQLTDVELAELQSTPHLPLYATLQISHALREGVDSGDLDRFAFMQAEEQRAGLVDHMGACERILKTPLAKVVSIKIRRFLFLYLSILPVAVVERCGFLTGFLTMLVAYPLLSLDQIGIELENPFSKNRLSHLPLDEISKNIQRNVQMVSEFTQSAGEPTTIGPHRNGRRIVAGVGHSAPRAVS